MAEPIALHPLEKKLLSKLSGQMTVEELEKACGLQEVEIMRAVLWLESKKLIKVETSEEELAVLKEPNFEFPERKALKQIAEKPMRIEEIDRAAIAWLARKKWATIENGAVKITEEGKKAEKTGDERLFERLQQAQDNTLRTADLSPEEKEALKSLSARPKVITVTTKSKRKISLTADEGQKVMKQGFSLEEEIAQLTPELIKSGAWKTAKFRRYDLKAPSPKVFPGKKHPLQAMIDQIRQIFLEMGFTEAKGPYIESAFWNFDALFQPQDHPARELADTFYLKNPAQMKLPEKYVEDVKAMHETGGNIKSAGWGYKWDKNAARKAVLRTHTTAVSARSLSTIKPPAKVFCLGRVFRNETIDYKHLAEFHQVEGIVADENVNFKDLLGYLKQFYLKLGFKKVRFRPAYFPYTEMSVEPEVYFEDKKEWIELGGAGIFRPEVTEPFGIKCPVLAWGLGLERPVMLKLGLNDLRTFYTNDLKWLMESPQI